MIERENDRIEEGPPPAGADGAPREPEIHDGTTRFGGLSFAGILTRSLLVLYLPCVAGGVLAGVQESSHATKTFWALFPLVPGAIGGLFGARLTETLGGRGLPQTVVPLFFAAIATALLLRVAWAGQRAGGATQLVLGGIVAACGALQSYGLVLALRA
ncbi:MAG: hypothetical protein AAFP86_20830 [Planctomycetota bacterium]